MRDPYGIMPIAYHSITNVMTFYSLLHDILCGLKMIVYHISNSHLKMDKGLCFIGTISFLSE